MKAKDVLKQFEEEFQEEQDERRRVHDEMVEGLIKPLIDQGLVDDVEPEFTREELGICPVCDATLMPTGECRFCPEMSIDEMETW